MSERETKSSLSERNEKVIRCSRCSGRIMSPGSALLVEKRISLPCLTAARTDDDDEDKVEMEEYDRWWFASKTEDFDGMVLTKPCNDKGTISSTFVRCDQSG